MSWLAEHEPDAQELPEAVGEPELRAILNLRRREVLTVRMAVTCRCGFARVTLCPVLAENWRDWHAMQGHRVRLIMRRPRRPELVRAGAAPPAPRPIRLP